MLKIDKVFGYGEDGLTLRFFTTQLEDFLKIVEDSSAPDDCKFFYRPSFGRGGRNSKSTFGEFDGILSTPRKIYLIESKCWANSRKPFLLDKAQMLRHEIFKKYYEVWEKGTKWEEIKLEFLGKLLPSGDSLLAKNLSRILDQLMSDTGARKEIMNVLIFFVPEGVTRKASFSVAPQVKEKFTVLFCRGASASFELFEKPDPCDITLS